jgi:hypothetical protein
MEDEEDEISAKKAKPAGRRKAKTAGGQRAAGQSAALAAT